MRGCKVEDCDRVHRSQGYCAKHYVAARRKGTISLLPQTQGYNPPPGYVDDLWEFVKKELNINA